MKFTTHKGRIHNFFVSCALNVVSFAIIMTMPSNPPQPPPASGAPGTGHGKPSGPADDTRLLALETQVKELTAKLQQMTDLAGRAQADLQNAKIRMQKDSDDLRKFAAESVIIRLLPLIDNFQRAFQHLPADLKDHEWVKGVLAIEQNLVRTMGEMGLKKMEAKGRQVDTARHDVVTIGKGKEGEIIDVIDDGYELNGKILRAAKVIVGGGSAQ